MPASTSLLSTCGQSGQVVLFASAHPSPPLSVDHNLIHKNEVTWRRGQERRRLSHRVKPWAAADRRGR
jgi:hypothetical protein